MPRPSISTVFPSATPRSTMRATCWQESQHSAMPLRPLPLEGQPATGSGPKTPQARKPRLFPLAHAVEYFLNQPVQAVGGLPLCSARLAGHLLRNFGLLHYDFTLATGKGAEPRGLSPGSDNQLFFKNLAI